jgi:hypothetical protein
MQTVLSSSLETWSHMKYHHMLASTWAGSPPHFKWNIFANVTAVRLKFDMK